MDPATPSKAFCLKCNYPLRGLAEPKCPECGREFDPNDPRTFITHPIGSLTRWIVGRIPLWPINLAGIAILLAQFWLQRFNTPEKSQAIWGRLKYCWVGVAICFLLATILPPVVAIIGHVPRSIRSRIRMWSLLLCMSLVAVGGFAQTHNWPLKLSFRLSRPSLERFANTTLDEPLHYPYADRNVGMFHLTEIYALGSEVGFEFDSHGNGFVYSPGHAPHADDAIHCDPIGDGWYRLKRDLTVAAYQERLRWSLLGAIADGDVPATKSIDWIIDSLSTDLPPPPDTGVLGDDTGNNPPSPKEWVGDYWDLTDPSDPALIRPDMRALARIGRAAVPALRLALKNADPNVRIRACAVLGMMGPNAADAAGDLEKLLDDSAINVADLAPRALLEMGPAGYRILAANLNGPSKHDQALAARILIDAHVRDPIVLAAYKQYLESHVPKSATSQAQQVEEFYANADGLFQSSTRFDLLDELTTCGPEASSLLPVFMQHYISNVTFWAGPEAEDERFKPFGEQFKSRSEDFIYKAVQFPIACGQAGKAESPAFWHVLEAAIKDAPKPWTDEKAFYMLGCIAPGYPPAVDHLLAELQKAHSDMLAHLNDSEPYTFDEQNLQRLASLLEALDPENLSIRKIINEDCAEPESSIRRSWGDALKIICPTSDPRTVDGIAQRLSSSFPYDLPGLLKRLEEIGPAAAPAVDSLVKRLESSDNFTLPFITKAQCLQTFTNIGPLAYEALRVLDSSSDDPLEVAAIRSIQTHSQDQVIKSTNRYLKQFHPDAPEAGNLNQAVSVLCDELRPGNLDWNNPAEYERWVECMCILRLAGPQAHHAIPTLLPMSLAHPVEVAATLGDITGPFANEVLPTMEAALTSNDFNIRTMAITVLGRLGAQGVPALQKAQADGNIPDPWVAIHYRLKADPSPEELDAIHESMMQYSGWQRNSPILLQYIELMEKHRIPAQQALPYLTVFLANGDAIVRKRAVEVLAELGGTDSAAGKELEARAYGDMSPVVRQAAREALDAKDGKGSRMEGN